MQNQIKKCTVSGFVTGLGGILTIPVTVPANIASVLYADVVRKARCRFTRR